MNKLLQTLLFVLPTALLAPAAPAAEVGVSIGISQPGVYGRIDLGRFPRPDIVYAEPVLAQRIRHHAPPPVYLWVPVEHQRRWHRYCHRYEACGVPVYFVAEPWYQRHVMREHHRHHQHRRDRDWRDDRRDDRRHDRHPHQHRRDRD